VIVVDGAASALEAAPGTTVPEQALRLAKEAARALNADLVALIIALDSTEPVVWDVDPIPDFRHAMPVAGVTVAQAIAEAVERRLATAVPGFPAERGHRWTGYATRADRQELGLRRDLVISA
jgi:hypothetical protein